MRIGVITQPLRLNYGGILQAYALQCILRDMGCDVFYIDWNQYKFQRNSIKTYFMRFLWKLKLLGRQRVIVFSDFAYKRLYKKINKFSKFNISIFSVDSFEQLCEDDFDVIIVGSDQVWRPFDGYNIEDFYFRFAKDWDIKRIAYAASFGIGDLSEYTSDEIVSCSNLAKRFDAISVREDSGVALCRNYLGVEAQHVLDPTMLVDIKHYIRHINSCKKQYPNRMCLAYILDESDDKSQLLHTIAKQCNYNIQQWENIDTPSMKKPTVEEWLKGFHDAEFVFTDSFHGCVFSIIFNKPFIAFGNVNRGMTRFNSLLKMFGLEELLITSIDQFTPELVDRAISRFSDNSIQQRLNELRKESKDFLERALSL